MMNDILPNNLPETDTAIRPETTQRLTRGAGRFFRASGYAILTEFKLPNGRRADICGLDKKGRIVIGEVKSCEADFTCDKKWHEYLGFCDEFYFIVEEDFPRALLPDNVGIVIADGYGADVLVPAPPDPLPAARRKALTLRYARTAALRAMRVPENE